MGACSSALRCAVPMLNFGYELALRTSRELKDAKTLHLSAYFMPASLEMSECDVLALRCDLHQLQMLEMLMDLLELPRRT
eukprot:14135483-Alexandrium_andersonii.AAC.1